LESCGTSYAAKPDRDASEGRDCSVQQGSQKFEISENQRFVERRRSRCPPQFNRGIQIECATDGVQKGTMHGHKGSAVRWVPVAPSTCPIKAPRKGARESLSPAAVQASPGDSGETDGGGALARRGGLGGANRVAGPLLVSATYRQSRPIPIFPAPRGLVLGP
jgi:hypothetical protein